tara:strand:+ start:2214 stop:2495 length:282 start_codon:yes stop_codon:yes gene_type:complete
MSLNNENPELLQAVNPVNEMKKWLINYVGDKLNPENDEVNVEMIIQVMASEFPEFVLVIAEENFIRGYKQGLVDSETMTNPSISENGAFGSVD